MPQGFSIPYPTVDYNIDVCWPIIAQIAVGAAFLDTGNIHYGGQTYAIFGAVVGAAANNMGRHRDVLCGQFQSDGAGATSERCLSGASMYLPLKSNAVAANFQYGAELRVWRWQLAVALAAASAISDESGFVIEPAAGANPGWLKFGNAGFGFVGDGAGNWMYVAKNVAGVGVYSEAIVFDGLAGRPAWPSARDEYVLVDFELLGANGLSDAALNIYLNGERVIARDWSAGTFLPSYTSAGSPANAARFVPHVRMGDAAINDLLEIAAGMRFMAGQFGVNGGKV